MQQAPLRGSLIWIDKFCAARGVFILTHCHTDHMVGLRRGWNTGIIHCSDITAALIVARGLCCPRILRTHGVEEPFEIEDPLRGPRPAQPIIATFVDSGHCPDSVMVVVEGL